VDERYTTAQMVTVPIAPARDPVAHRAANRNRMVAWSLLGSGTHNALAYLLAALSFFWPAALVAFFVLNLSLFNLFLLLLLALERRRTA